MKFFQYIILLGVCAMPTAATYAVDAQPITQTASVKNMLSGKTIKVLLAKDLEGAQVEVKGGYYVYDPLTGKELEHSLMSSSFYMFPITEGIKWGAEFPGVYQLLIVPKKGTILVSGIEYRGMVYAYQIDGALAFVNEVSIDDYADTQLSTKVPAAVANEEVLAALSIAAQTDALYKSSFAQTAFFDVRAPLVHYAGHGLSRSDLAFQEVMKNTKQIVLTNGKQHEKVVGFAIDWFDGTECSAPLEKMHQLAQEGHDAKSILQELFPNATLVLAR